MFLPYLKGEDTPWFDDYARGVFFGIADNSTLADMTRSVIEGIAYSIQDALNYVRSLNLHPENLYFRFMGKMPFIEQIIADVTGIPIYSINRGGPTLGLFMLMSVSAGLWSDLPSAAHALGHISALAEPDNYSHEIYQSLYDLHSSLYPAMENTFKNLHNTIEKVNMQKKPIHHTF
jgi:xylulokinase